MITHAIHTFATEQDAASTDWVIDTSGTYLCRGYYSPAMVAGAPGDQELNAKAQNTGYDGSDRVILTGDASLTRGDFQLEADRISFLNSTGDGDAAGEVKIRRPNTLLIGDSASVNLRTNAFDLKNSSFVTPNNRLRGKSKFAIGAPNGDVRIIDGTMTFCAPGVNSWDLKADQIFINESSGRGWANGVIIRVKEVPIIYTPVLGFPLDDRRLTGFLFPAYTVGSKLGTEIRTPFYWNAATNLDLLIRPRSLTARGSALGLQGRYLFKDYSLLDFKTEQLPGDKITETDRYISRIALSSSPTKSVTWYMNYENASDAEYQNDLNNFAELSDEKQLSSSIGATVRGDTWSVGWVMDRIDIIDSAISGSDIKFSRNPQLTGSWAHYGKKVNFFTTGDVTEFSRDSNTLGAADPSKGRRVSSNVKAELPFSSEYGSITAALLGFTRWSESVTDGVPRRNQNFALGTSLDGSLLFEKSGAHGAMHEIIPRVKLLVLEPNKDVALTNFDTQENGSETISQIFLDNPVSGGDFVGDTREINISVTSKGLDANGFENYRFSAGRKLFFQNQGITLSGIQKSRKKGPLIAQSAIKLTDNLNWNTHFESRADSESLANATNEFKYRGSDSDYVVHRIIWENDRATRTDFYYSNQIGLNWRVLAGIQWAQATQERTNQVLGFEYESCCWRGAVVHAYERDQVTLKNSGNSIKFQLEFKGLGATGRGGSTIMDRLLEDYELSEARY